MESTVSNQIVDVIDALCEKFGIVIDWTSQNVLPYAQELMKRAISYELWTSVLSIVLFFFLTTICWLVVWRLSKTPEFRWSDAFEEAIPTTAAILVIVGIILTTGLLCLVIDESADIITCLTFPEKIILDMLKTVE